MAASVLLVLTLCSAALTVYSASLTTPPVLLVPGCEWNGKTYPDGQRFNPDPCTFCNCQQGRPMCAVADCAPPPCVDSVRDPDQCCPVCPNGHNCRAPDGTVIKAGQEAVIQGSMTCTCPTSGPGFFMGSGSALCSLVGPVSAAPTL